MAWWATCSSREGFTSVTQMMTLQRQRGKMVELLLEERRFLCDVDCGGGQRGQELLRGSFHVECIPIYDR